MKIDREFAVAKTLFTYSGKPEKRAQLDQEVRTYLTTDGIRYFRSLIAPTLAECIKAARM